MLLNWFLGLGFFVYRGMNKSIVAVAAGGRLIKAQNI
jgi:hypothetical protein